MMLLWVVFTMALKGDLIAEADDYSIVTLLG
jgi:hypothetical protein